MSSPKSSSNLVSDGSKGLEMWRRRGEGIGKGGLRKGTDFWDRGENDFTSYTSLSSELASELPKAGYRHFVILTKLTSEIKLQQTFVSDGTGVYRAPDQGPESQSWEEPCRQWLHILVPLLHVRKINAFPWVLRPWVLTPLVSRNFRQSSTKLPHPWEIDSITWTGKRVHSTQCWVRFFYLEFSLFFTK